MGGREQSETQKYFSLTNLAQSTFLDRLIIRIKFRSQRLNLAGPIEVNQWNTLASTTSRLPLRRGLCDLIIVLELFAQRRLVVSFLHRLNVVIFGR